MAFKPLDKSKIFISRNDPNDLRIGDLIAAHDTTKTYEYALVAYPDDEGILNNSGRIGAAEGPLEIRKIFYKSTPSAIHKKTLDLVDLGDLDTQYDLATRHENSKNFLIDLYQKQSKIISFGGGHDYAYPDVAAFLKVHATNNKKPLVINFDAHLDVRPLKEKINSGTPFYRLLKEFPGQFEFVEIGLQTQCNSAEHLNWLEENGGRAIWFDSISGQSTEDLQFLFEKLNLKQQDCFLSVDLDVFSSAFAPGCSQSWPTGLNPEFFWQVFSRLKKNLNIMGLGLYECCPRLDVDSRTSRLAAKIAYDYIYL